MPEMDRTNKLRGAGATAGGRPAPEVAAPGRWTIDASRSNLQISVKVGLLGTVRGRFTTIAGRVEMSADPTDSHISVEVATSSLTSGSAHWDAVLISAGLVDTAMNPTIAFESTGMRAHGSGWELTGILLTNRGCLSVTFTLACLSEDNTDRIRFRASGNLSSKDAVRLLSQPSFERLIGKTMGIEMTVEAVRASHRPAPASH